MIRALGGAAVVGVALSVAVQAAPVVLPPELMQKALWGMLAGVGSLVLAAVGVVVKLVMTFFKDLRSELTTVLGVVAKITQEVYGPSGTNGMRGDIKGLKAGVRRHDRELEVLCHEHGIERVEDPA